MPSSAARAAHRLGGLQRPAAGEHAELREQLALAGIRAGRSSSRSWRAASAGARARRAGRAAEQVEPVRRAARGSPPAAAACTRAAASSIASGSPSSRRQIARDRARGPRRRPERRIARAGALVEQLDGRVGGERRHRATRARRRGAATARLVTRSVIAGRGREQAADVGRRVEHLLEVVEHEQQRAVRERAGQPVEHAAVGAVGEPERAGERREDVPGVADRGERDEPRAVGELRRQPARELEREPRLADAARAR